MLSLTHHHIRQTALVKMIKLQFWSLCDDNGFTGQRNAVQQRRGDLTWSADEG